MFCHLNYSLDRKFYRDYFFENFSKAKHHKTETSELKFWFKLLHNDKITESVINELTLKGLNV
jgi:hypothetical protein